MIYLDNAATTKVSDVVIEKMLIYYSKHYSNSSSKHFFGQQNKHALNDSRKDVSKLLNCSDSEIYFTSGATESINMALRGYVQSNIDEGSHIITSTVEHKAVLETCEFLESIGIDVTYLNVDSSGLIDLKELENSIKPETLLVSMLWVNNETGVIQNIKAISKIVKQKKTKLFVDATQVIGKMPVDVVSLGIDMLCLSAHKFHGPKGVGAIFISDKINIEPIIFGGGQENGLRSGTVNIPGIIGLAEACKIANFDTSNVEKIRNHLEKSLLKNFNCTVVGLHSPRSPFITNIIFDGIDADVIIGQLQETVLSTGSACSSEINEPSHVLKNMAIDNDMAFGSIRFSFSKYTSIEEINKAINELKLLIKQ